MRGKLINFNDYELAVDNGIIIPARSIINPDNSIITIPSIIFDEMDERGSGEDSLVITGTLGNDIIDLGDVSHHEIKIDWSTGSDFIDINNISRDPYSSRPWDQVKIEYHAENFYRHFEDQGHRRHRAGAAAGHAACAGTEARRQAWRIAVAS